MANFDIFFRRWRHNGTDMRQQITVYARSVEEARKRLDEDLRQHGGPAGGAPTQARPSFEVQELRLDEPKVLTSVFTTA